MYDVMQSSFSFSFIFDNKRCNNFPKYMFYRCALKELSLLHKLINLYCLSAEISDNNVQYVAKSIATCKKIPIYNQPKPYLIFFYCEVISGQILTNFTPKHSELSIF